MPDGKLSTTETKRNDGASAFPTEPNTHSGLGAAR